MPLSDHESREAALTLDGSGDDAEFTPESAQGFVSQLAEIMGLVFRPGAAELGLIVQDEVQAWRLWNLRRLGKKLRKRDAKGRAHPRVGMAALQQASATDDETLLDMWAGLIDSSRAERPDDANITFVARLSDMSALQARILCFLCERCPKFDADGLLFSRREYWDIEGHELFGSVSRELLDQELDQLRASGLADVGINLDFPTQVFGCPTALGLYLYVRCQGSQLAPADYFMLEAQPYRPASQSPVEGEDGREQPGS